MDTKSTNDIVTSKMFMDIPGLVHGFSTRGWGDMRIPKQRRAFITSLGLQKYEEYHKFQMHGDIVHVIDEKTNLDSLSDADGAIVLTHGIKTRHIVLTVRSADCVPILFVDPKTKMIGVVHAGWQGTLLGIAKIVVEKMKQNGSATSDIQAFIGSHIGACCYSIDELRAEKFNKRYTSSDKVIHKRNGTYFADLGRANILDLEASGIKSTHIDCDPVCTSCSVHNRFSYRQDTPDSYGVMMGAIAWK
jgi:polyphenol oxidase